MNILKRFDSLMDHLNSREDDIAMMFRCILEDVEDKLAWLSALEAAGVDNWEGCEYASDLFNEWTGAEEE